MKRTWIKRSTKPIPRRTKLRVVGHSSATELKKEIQALLREICLVRDKRCVLYGIRCHNEVGTEGIVFQAEHLIERSNSATYDDPRLVVLVCKNCHGWKHFTKSNHDQYDRWVKTVISEERVRLWERATGDSWRATRKGSYDWKLAIVVLKQTLNRLKGEAGLTVKNEHD